jgi:hypothetical protein
MMAPFGRLTSIAAKPARGVSGAAPEGLTPVNKEASVKVDTGGFDFTTLPVIACFLTVSAGNLHLQEVGWESIVRLLEDTVD